MRYWKIHAGWALATLIFAAAWGRWSASQREGEFRQRERDLEIRIIEARQTRAATPPASAPSSSQPAPALPTAQPDVLPSLPAYKFEALTSDQIRALIHSDNKTDWSKAALAIDRLADSALQKDLLIEFLPCKDENVRMHVLSSLQMKLGAESTPLIQKALSNDPSMEVRRRAAIYLGDLGGEGTIETLLRATHDENLIVQLSAASALNRLGQPGPAAEWIPRLSADLDSPDGGVRRQAVDRLTLLMTPLAIPAFVRALQDTNGDVRMEAIGALGFLGSPDLIPLLEGMLKDPVPAVAEAAKATLDMIKERKEK